MSAAEDPLSMQQYRPSSQVFTEADPLQLPAGQCPFCNSRSVATVRSFPDPSPTHVLCLFPKRPSVNGNLVMKLDMTKAFDRISCLAGSRFMAHPDVTAAKLTKLKPYSTFLEKEILQRRSGTFS
ncbi:hypothetical protein HAX54_021041 [Datura stramonium]|uniref:Reverse transcriptase n=1 Tax=Datura stramonium TaxID=4076 RepID=A0ABS8UT74_DATST|nr:hypothetical protein [Datura stramonium]